MGSKGSNTTTTSSAPNPQAMQAYQNLLTQAGGVASTPYTPYTGQLVAPNNAQQFTGISGINNYAGFAQPYIQQAGNLAAGAAAPITAAQIQNYVNPYTQSVVNATQAQFNNQNAQQLQNVRGNAIAQGAMGGNREAVAEAELANQQQLAQAPVIANLNSQGYAQGVNTALAEQQAAAQGAYSLGNLGVAGQNAGLTGANAQVGAGTLEQQTQQAQNTAAYQQFLNQLAYPFQTTQWLAGIDTGVGSQMGGTSSTTGPAPSMLSQLGGLGTALTGMFGQSGMMGGLGGIGSGLSGLFNTGTTELASGMDAAGLSALTGEDAATSALALAALPFGMRRGGGIANRDVGGNVNYSTFGGGFGTPIMPYSGGHGWIPSMGITHGRGAPPPPGIPQSNNDLMQQAKSIGSIANAMTGKPSAPSATPDSSGGVLPTNYSPAVYDPLGPGPYKRGGVVGYADGGGPYDQDPDQVPLPRPRPTGSVVATLPPEITTGSTRGVPQDNNGPELAYAGGRGSGGIGWAPPVVTPPTLAPTDLTYSPPPSGSVANNTGIDWSSNSKLWPALMAAGFGMMASRSPFPGVAIGEGGLQGLQTYSNEVAQEREQALNQQKMQLEAKKLSDQLDIENRKLEEEKNWHGGELGLKQQTETREANAPHLLGQRTIYDPTHPYQQRTVAVYGVRGADGLWRDPTNGKLIDMNNLAPAGTPSPTVAAPSAPSVAPGVNLYDPKPIGGQYATGGMPGDDTPDSITHHDDGDTSTVPDTTPDAPAPTRMAQNFLPAPAADTASDAPPNITMMKTVPNQNPFGSAAPSRPSFEGMMAEIAKGEQGKHGKEFLDMIPPELDRNAIEAAAFYQADPNKIFSTGRFATIPRADAMSIIYQLNPDFEASWYNNVKGNALKNFYASTSPNSPVVQARFYNTAMGHAGELAEAIDQLHHANPGVFQQAREAGIPFLSYLAANAQQKIARGTPEGEAWTRINSILPLYAAETEKFYAGGQGSETGRQEIQSPFNPNLSFKEMMGALYQQMQMYKSKTQPLEQEFSDVVNNAPGLKQYGTNTKVRQWAATKDNALKAEDTIRRVYAEAGGHPEGQNTQQNTQMSPEAINAINWANANPNDPRAAAIKQHFGVR